MGAVIDTYSKQAKNEPSNTDELAALQSLLLGPEYKALLQQKGIQEDPELYAAQLAKVITQALKERDNNDGSIQKLLTPIIEKSLTESVTADPKPISEALYPVIAPAIRKSINVSITEMVNNINELLENSLSPQSFKWRFDAWRTGKSYAEVVVTNTLVFQVEQVFLVHRETGLLLQHMVSPNAVSKDPDVVSGMLTAIQDFMTDSFHTETNSDLDTLKLGDLTILIEHGPSAVLAAVVRGLVPSGLHQLLAETTEVIHAEERSLLKNYNGDSSEFDHVQPLLALCLQNKKRNSEATTDTDSEEDATTDGLSKKKLFGIAVGLCGVAAIGYFSYAAYVKGKQWDELQQAIRAEPGIVVSHVSNEDGVYQLHGLADPMAKSPQSLASDYTKESFSVETSFRPYLSLEPKFVEQRLIKALQPPTTLNMTLENTVLHLSGTADADWLNKLMTSAPLFAGVSSINLDKLEATTAN